MSHGSTIVMPDRDGVRSPNGSPCRTLVDKSNVRPVMLVRPIAGGHRWVLWGPGGLEVVWPAEWKADHYRGRRGADSARLTQV